MNARQGYRRLALGVVAFGLILSSVAFAKILAVSLVTQEQNQWCWAATSKCVINYYGTSVTQCEIAEFTRTHSTWHDFGSVNCCTDPGQGCNYANYLAGGGGSIQDILAHWGLSSSIWYREMWQNEVSSTLNDNRPFIMRWGWTSGGGHFLVGYGLEVNNMYYMDPWYGEGLKVATYDWVVSGSDHTWTHSAVLMTPISTKMLQTAVNDASLGTTSPAPGIYTYRTGSDVEVRALPAQYCAFTVWYGDVFGKDNPVIVHLDRDKTAMANFRLISPPSNLKAVRLTNRSVTQTESIIELSWDANTANAGLNIVAYRVYQMAGNSWVNLGEISGGSRTYRCRLAPKEERTYGVTSVYESGVESARTTVVK